MDRAPDSSPASSPLQTAWPRSTQLATAFLLGGAVALLAVQAWQSLAGGTRPSELKHSPIDLNRAGRAELSQLPGIGPALAERIEAHRQSNGAFRKVDDLRGVHGIGPATLERIRPYVHVVEPGDAEPVVQTRPEEKARPAGKKETPLDLLVDINRAQAEELQRLPGIGPVLSQRIIDQREKTPFQSVEDLRRVPGIGPKTLEKVRPFVCVRSEVELATSD